MLVLWHGFRTDFVWVGILQQDSVDYSENMMLLILCMDIINGNAT